MLPTSGSATAARAVDLELSGEVGLAENDDADLIARAQAVIRIADDALGSAAGKPALRRRGCVRLHDRRLCRAVGARGAAGGEDHCTRRQRGQRDAAGFNGNNGDHGFPP
jgi:hypothetical protein